MLKGMMIGVLAGVILAAGAWRAFASRKEAPAQTTGGAPATTTAGAADPELDKAKAENTRLREELTAIRKTPVPDVTGAPTAPVKRPALTWKDIGAKVYKLRHKLKENDHSNPEMGELMSEFFTMLGEAAKRDGVTLDEVIMSPEGMLALLLGILDASDLPPDGAQHAKFELAMADIQKNWKEYLAGRADRNAMERSRDLLALGGSGMSAMNSTMTPEQRAMIDSLDMFNDVPGGGMSSRISGERSVVADTLALNWQSDLGLDDGQIPSIKPIVDEYMRGFDALQMEADRRKSAGDPMDDWSQALQRQELMLSVQKRMKETLRLNDKQAEAMKEWNRTYGYTISGAK